MKREELAADLSYMETAAREIRSRLDSGDLDGALIEASALDGAAGRVFHALAGAALDRDAARRAEDARKATGPASPDFTHVAPSLDPWLTACGRTAPFRHIADPSLFDYFKGTQPRQFDRPLCPDCVKAWQAAAKK